MKKISNFLLQLPNKAKTALVILFLIVGSSSEEQVVKTDLKSGALKGKVKDFKDFTYLAEEKNGIVVKTKETTALYIAYNINGNKRETIYSKPSMPIKDTFMYDNKAKLVEWDRTAENEKLNSKSLFSYDAKGNQVEQNYKNFYGTAKSIFKYDNNGNMIEWTTLTDNLNFVLKNTYQYDNRGNQIEWDQYFTDGSLEYKYAFKYDNKGNQIEWSQYKPDGSLNRHDIFKFDSNGNRVEWDSNITSSNPVKYTYKYEFDAYSNIVKEIQYENGKPTLIFEIEIEYY